MGNAQIREDSLVFDKDGNGKDVELGKGASGLVKLARLIRGTTEEFVAVKFFPQLEIDDTNEVLNEILVRMQL